MLVTTRHGSAQARGDTKIYVRPVNAARSVGTSTVRWCDTTSLPRNPLSCKQKAKGYMYVDVEQSSSSSMMMELWRASTNLVRVGNQERSLPHPQRSERTFPLHGSIYIKNKYTRTRRVGFFRFRFEMVWHISKPFVGTNSFLDPSLTQIVREVVKQLFTASSTHPFTETARAEDLQSRV